MTSNSTIGAEASYARAGHQYEPDEFINRRDVLDIVDKILLEGARAGGRGQPVRSVIALSGVQGIGKSWLLQHILYLSRSGELGRDRSGSTRRETLAAYASFADVDADPVRAPVTLIDTLYRQFSDGLRGVTPGIRAALSDLDEALVRVRRGGADGDTPANLFVRLAAEIGAQMVPILLLDALEAVPFPSDLFRWLENELLAPLAGTDRTLIVLAGRKDIRVRNFEVRRRFLPIRLRPFDSEDTLRQVEHVREQDGRSPAAGDAIYTYSVGHPYTTWKLSHEVRGTLDDSTPPAEAARTLGEVEAMLLQDTPDSLRKRLRLVSVLRKFNVNSLRLLLAAQEDPALRDQKDPYFLEMIDDMVRSNLVFWSQEAKAYVMDEPARQIMNRLLRLQDPAAYRQRQQAALDIYRQWIHAYPGIGDFVVEALYHLAARELTPTGRAAESVWNEMDALLEGVFRREDAHYLPPDGKELCSALREDDELAALLPDDLRDRLLDRVGSLAD